MTVAMAIYNAQAEAIVIIIIQPYQENPDLFYKLDNVCTLTWVGEYKKIPAFGLGSSVGLCPRELPRPYAGISLYSPPLV